MVFALTESQETLWEIANWAGLAVVVAVALLAPLSLVAGLGVPLRLGTRGSALALAQTGLIAARLQEAGMETSIVTIRTEGDRAQADRSMMLGRGAFVKELERALLEGEVDLAVHSAKDLPTGDSPGLSIVAWPEREDPRDALVSAAGVGLADLPPGALNLVTGSGRVVGAGEHSSHFRTDHSSRCVGPWPPNAKTVLVSDLLASAATVQPLSGSQPLDPSFDEIAEMVVSHGVDPGDQATDRARVGGPLRRHADRHRRRPRRA